jgi:predicted nucleic acid-binding protein
VILLDTGPIVALLDRSDPHHPECIAASARLEQADVVTAWPVITEAMYLLGFSWPAQRALLDRLSRGALRVLDVGRDDMPSIRTLMEKYGNVPMDFADATLVRLAERERTRTVFTLDRRGFSTYRIGRSARFDIIPG